VVITLDRRDGKPGLTVVARTIDKSNAIMDIFLLVNSAKEVDTAEEELMASVERDMEAYLEYTGDS
jgi:hypothetical protein